MVKARSKWIAILATLALLATLLVPMVGPAAAGAATYNTVTKVPTFDPSTTGAADQKTATIQIKLDPALAVTSSAKVEVLAADGKQLKIEKVMFDPAWDSSTVAAVYVNGEEVSSSSAQVDFSANPVKVFDLAFKPTATTATAALNFYLVVDAKDCAEGEVKVNFFATSGQLDAGQVVVAKAAKGQVKIALVGTPPSIGEGGDYVTIRLSQTAGGALKVENDKVLVGVLKFKLPAGFKWSDVTTPVESVSSVVYACVDPSNDRVLLVCTKDIDNTSNPDGTPKVSPAPSVVDITAKVSVSDTSTAKTGDVTATIETDQNTSFTPSEIIVASYAEYGATAKVASVKEVLAGKMDQKTDTITIEEVIPGSLLQNRKITVTLPGWVKIVGWDSQSNSNISVAWETLPLSPKDCDNTATITINSTSSSKAKLEFKLKVLVEANKAGDIEATIGGAGMNETKLVVAKAVAPVTATAQVANVRIGVRDQAAPDLTITENKAGAIEKGDLLVILPDGVTFAATPSVEVVSGDLELQKDGVTVDGGTLTIKVKTESFKPSTLKISGIKLTVNRTVPEGALTVKIKGGALVEYGDAFTTDYVTKVQLANCVTPAPVEQKTTATFKVGEAKFTVNGAEQTMDVAPYVKNGRTYLPVRYVAMALGVAPENIYYADGVVTLLKGGVAVQLTIGSNVLKVNGAEIRMDVPAELSNGRTMLPFRWVAQALGASVQWDEATQTVTMNL